MSLRSAASISALVLVLGASSALGYLALYTTLREHDDEGYMIVMIREFLLRGALYEDVYSQYGPLHAEFWGSLVTVSGIELTHDSARMLNLAMWMSTTLLVGAATWRLTRSLFLGFLAQVISFLSLWSLVEEPLIAGSLTCPLLAALVAVSAFGLPSHPRIVASLTGVLLAALCLVKANVGALAAIAVLLAACLTPTAGNAHRLLRSGAVALALATPLVLMASSLDQPWAQRYAFVVVAALAAFIVTVWPAVEDVGRVSRRPSIASIAYLGFAFGLTAGVICLVAMLTGTSLDGLIRGVVRDPLRHPDVFTIPLRVSLAAVIFSVAALGLAVLTRARRPAWMQTGPAFLLAGLVILLAAVSPNSLSVLGHETAALAVAAPLAWVAVARHGEGSPFDHAQVFLPILVVALALLQTLHAYPVAGSQVGWSTFLLVPVGAICLARGRLSSRERLMRRGALCVVAVVAGISAIQFIARFETVWSSHRAKVELGLEGADRVRVDAETARDLRSLVRDIRAHCDSFVTLPGMNGLYVMSGFRPPTGLNATSWMYLLDSQRQRRVRDVLASQTRVCVVRNDALLDFWARGREIPSLPLYRFATSGTMPIADYGDYLLMRKG